MEILQVRPARVSAALVAIGDMLVTSPIGANGPRQSRWLGAVTEHIIVSGKEYLEPSSWRQWRIALVNGQSTETAVVPADGWVWVHLPMVDAPSAPVPAGNAWGPMPDQPGPAQDAWLKHRGWSSYEEWANR